MKGIAIVGGILAFFLLLFLPLDPAVLSPAAKATAAVAGLMVVWWVTEALPIYVTALVPLILFPLLGILPADMAARAYGDKTVFLFMGGFFIAISMQKWNLHRRIALSIVQYVGTHPKRIVLGFMIATAFMSMWISNTASAMMMTPIAVALVATLLKENDPAVTSSPQLQNFTMCLILGVAYSATIGGMGTIIGTPPNGILIAQMRAIFPDAPPIDFFSFMVFAVPFAAVFLILAWLWLTSVIFRDLPSAISESRTIIREELQKLGPMNKGERNTLLVFIGVALAWILRTQKNLGGFILPGINTVLPGIDDSTIAIAGALLLFLIPVHLDKGIFTLSWESAREIPWGILILFGGGIALSEGFFSSGLATIIAERFNIFQGLPIVVILLLILFVITYLNELVSNTAIASILIPLMAVTSLSLGIHPFLLMIGAALGSSLGFMLPVGTPPNAIAYGTGYLTTRDMIRAGMALNIIGVLLVTTVMMVLVPWALGFSLEVPSWAVILQK
jgi:sodium-dependent dicarboxylate transporter 2/3/5